MWQAIILTKAGEITMHMRHSASMSLYDYEAH